MSEITILHLSDIHFRKKKDDHDITFRKNVQQKLIRAVQEHSELHNPPDVVAITGDIAFSGKKHEYDEALDFFEKLKIIFQKDTPFLAVPGNHDVDRHQVDTFASLYNVVKHKQVDEFLKQTDQVKSKIFVKFKAFKKFLHQVNPTIGEMKKSRWNYFWVKNFKEQEVSFLGLNSAWASESNEDRMNIALGNQQVMQALEKSAEIPYRIVLMHHPLFNWLEESDSGKWSGTVFNQCQLILHGHVHVDAAACISTPSDSCICLCANASYTHDGHIGFQFIRVRFNENRTVVRVWPYIFDPREQPDFFPDTRRWKGQKNKPYFDIATLPKDEPCDEETVSLRPLKIPGEYKEWVVQFHSQMDTQRLDPNATAYYVPLPDVYIPLETTNPSHQPKDRELIKEKDRSREIKGKKIEEDQDQKEPPLIDIERLLERKNCILVRGMAGMGKTTLIKHLAYTITQGKAPVTLCGILPVVIFLKDLQPPREKENLSTGTTIAATFAKRLQDYLDTQVGTLDMEMVERYLARNRVLFLLDGLDEVPEQFRGKLVEQMAAFRLKYKQNRFLLTGRPHGIDANAKKHFGQFLHDIEPLDEEKVNDFIYKWFRVVSGKAEGQAKSTAAEMIGDIKNNEHIKVFTENPLLLTAVCILYLDRQRLPDQRAELYRRIVDNLLYRRFHHLPPEKSSGIKDYLKHLAFHMQEHHFKTINVGEAKKLLKNIFRQNDVTETMPQYNRRINTLFEEIEPRCGLLKRRGQGDLEFFHLTFQEFLAARHMLYTETDFKKFLDNPWWEETLLLYISLVNQEWKDKANQIVKDILTYSHEDQKILWRLWLLGSKALRDIQAYKRDTGAAAASIEKLSNIINSNASLEQRFEAGDILGTLGDPRINVLKPKMVHVESGEFTRGGDEDDDEKPIGQIYLDEFMMGKYPVTNEEFKAFIIDGGYEKKDLWTSEGWQWRKDEKILAPDNWHDRKWNGPNFPVVGVSWYEAAAYVKWLSQKTGENYVLPTEAQWEKAGRGASGLIYPWGNKFDKNLCNSWEGGLKRTSPVGVFPGGESPYGCMDMAGNVWEWCGDWYEKDYYQTCPVKNPKGPNTGSHRVFRGGSWGDNAWYCRAAYRLGNHPAIRGADFGFRLARSS
ncbi:MAG: SUMF1/EgtB/PvdO family nonheme iron enzyme [Candidatus Aminicenantes bacterium]|jgi:formylglycine-generating enzyme required for sulfatase activity/predicted MPP superfamily phosphohydrolase